MCQKSECKIKKKTRRVLKLWSIFLSCLKILISQVNVAIGMLDFFLFEEFRDLSLWEWSLRNILKAHLLDFLQNHTFRSKQCVFLGYSPRHKCVKCLDVSTHVYFSRDIVFLMKTFVLLKLSIQMLVLFYERKCSFVQIIFNHMLMGMRI